jgi:hypothetical protein
MTILISARTRRLLAESGFVHGRESSYIRDRRFAGIIPYQPWSRSGRTDTRNVYDGAATTLLDHQGYACADRVKDRFHIDGHDALEVFRRDLEGWLKKCHKSSALTADRGTGIPNVCLVEQHTPYSYNSSPHYSPQHPAPQTSPSPSSLTDPNPPYPPHPLQSPRSSHPPAPTQAAAPNPLGSANAALRH